MIGELEKFIEEIREENVDNIKGFIINGDEYFRGVSDATEEIIGILDEIIFYYKTYKK